MMGMYKWFSTKGIAKGGSSIQHFLVYIHLFLQACKFNIYCCQHFTIPLLVVVFHSKIFAVSFILKSLIKKLKGYCKETEKEKE